MTKIAKLHKLRNKTILITGGTGSFGKKVTETLLKYSPRRIIIFSRDEKKQFDMRNEFGNNPQIKFIIGDVRDHQSVESVMPGVDFVFHAAALKQVPTCEFFPIEAVKTNILGAYNVFRVAIAHQVKRVVILSTDKAAYPINAMGLSKALMEKTMVAVARELEVQKNKKTIFCGVRYGNVMYSRGSVIPFFVNLIKENRKLPVTNLNMTRFLMTLEEAVNLVLHALTVGKNGHLYIYKTPACTMETLAKALCQMFNHPKGYEEVGIRFGEKMHETLVTTEEFLRAKETRYFFEIVPEGHELNYKGYYDMGKKSPRTLSSYSSNNTAQLNIKTTIKAILKVPEIKQDIKHHHEK